MKNILIVAPDAERSVISCFIKSSFINKSICGGIFHFADSFDEAKLKLSQIKFDIIALADIPGFLGGGFAFNFIPHIKTTASINALLFLFDNVRDTKKDHEQGLYIFDKEAIKFDVMLNDEFDLVSILSTQI